MTPKLSLLMVSALGLLLSSCASSSSNGRAVSTKGTRITSVRTTAYTHSESDHIVYGARTGDRIALWQMNADGRSPKELTTALPNTG